MSFPPMTYTNKGMPPIIDRACLCVILSVGVIAYSGMRKLMTSCSTLTLRGAMGLFIRRPSTLTSDWDLVESYLACAVGMNAARVEELAAQEEIPSLKELGNLGMIDHRHIEQTVVGHGVRSLSVAEGIAHTHRHHLALYLVIIDTQTHLILQTLEYHEDKGEDE